MENVESLYVLGNGFDLCLGMKTRYQNFFEADLQRIMIGNYKLRDIESEVFKNTNLFLAYLSEKHLSGDHEWNYIEKQIIGYVVYTKLQSGNQNNKSAFQSLLSHKIETKTLDEVIISEFEKFEEIFGIYIRDQNYNKSLADKNLTKIFTTLSSRIRSKIKVINFNYSNYLPKLYYDFCCLPQPEKYGEIKNQLYINKYEMFIDQVNVHGEYYKPIFGIDLNEVFKVCNSENDEYFINEKEKILISEIKPILKRMTKTARVLKNDTISDTWKLPDPKFLININFFGHSLSKADYSYFQSIFDYYSIYDSHIRLNFLYNENHDENGTEQHGNVMNLITDYGDTLDNKDKGKNLLHKMLLENRIKLIPLDV